MMLNFTLIIQVIHFVIAYVILRNLFLKPALQALHADELAYTQAQNAIKAEQASLDAYKKQELSLVRLFKQDMLQKQADFFSTIKSCTPVYPKEPTVHQSITPSTTVLKALKNAVIKRVACD